jgi:hypothetical protein
MNNIKERTKVYNYFVNLIKKKDFDTENIKLKKTRILGRGGQAYVKEMCENEKKCLAVKKIYIDWKLSEYLNDQYNPLALKDGIYIELLAGELLNQIVLQEISPHFALNYAWDYKERERSSICTDKYPYVMNHYNELISNTDTYTEWVKGEHSLKEWYNAYFQITTSIYVLQNYFNMTHFDLHSENILVQKVKKGGYYIYKIDNVIYKVPNLGYRFFIIDLGQAFIPKKFKSWYVKQEYSNKKITKSFDILFLFESTLEFSTSPPEFKKEIRKLINDIDNKEHFASIIYELWYPDLYDTIRKGAKLLEEFDLDKDIVIDDIPKELHHLILKLN